MKPWFFLALAIAAEVTATSALKASDGLSRLQPTLLVALGYGIAFYLLALTLRSIPVGVAYATWSGLGTALIAVAAWWLYGQRLDAAALIGIALIIAGVLVMGLFSSATPR